MPRPRKYISLISVIEQLLWPRKDVSLINYINYLCYDHGKMSQWSVISNNYASTTEIYLTDQCYRATVLRPRKDVSLINDIKYLCYDHGKMSHWSMISSNYAATTEIYIIDQCYRATILRPRNDVSLIIEVMVPEGSDCFLLFYFLPVSYAPGCGKQPKATSLLKSVTNRFFCMMIKLLVGLPSDRTSITVRSSWAYCTERLWGSPGIMLWCRT